MASQTDRGDLSYHITWPVAAAQYGPADASATSHTSVARGASLHKAPSSMAAAPPLQAVATRTVHVCPGLPTSAATASGENNADEKDRQNAHGLATFVMPSCGDAEVNPGDQQLVSFLDGDAPPFLQRYVEKTLALSSEEDATPVDNTLTLTPPPPPPSAAIRLLPSPPMKPQPASLTPHACRLYSPAPASLSPDQRREDEVTVSGGELVDCAMTRSPGNASTPPSSTTSRHSSRIFPTVDSVQHARDASSSPVAALSPQTLVIPAVTVATQRTPPSSGSSFLGDSRPALNASPHSTGHLLHVIEPVQTYHTRRWTLTEDGPTLGFSVAQASSAGTSNHHGSGGCHEQARSVMATVSVAGAGTVRPVMAQVPAPYLVHHSGEFVPVVASVQAQQLQQHANDSARSASGTMTTIGMASAIYHPLARFGIRSTNNINNSSSLNNANYDDDTNSDPLSGSRMSRQHSENSVIGSTTSDDGDGLIRSGSRGSDGWVPRRPSEASRGAQPARPASAYQHNVAVPCSRSVNMGAVESQPLSWPSAAPAAATPSHPPSSLVVSRAALAGDEEVTHVGWDQSVSERLSFVSSRDSQASAESSVASQRDVEGEHLNAVGYGYGRDAPLSAQDWLVSTRDDGGGSAEPHGTSFTLPAASTYSSSSARRRRSGYRGASPPVPSHPLSAFVMCVAPFAGDFAETSDRPSNSQRPGPLSSHVLVDSSSVRSRQPCLASSSPTQTAGNINTTTTTHTAAASASDLVSPVSVAHTISRRRGDGRDDASHGSPDRSLGDSCGEDGRDTPPPHATTAAAHSSVFHMHVGGSGDSTSSGDASEHSVASHNTARSVDGSGGGGGGAPLERHAIHAVVSEGLVAVHPLDAPPALQSHAPQRFSSQEEASAVPPRETTEWSSPPPRKQHRVGANNSSDAGARCDVVTASAALTPPLTTFALSSKWIPSPPRSSASARGSASALSATPPPATGRSSTVSIAQSPFPLSRSVKETVAGTPATTVMSNLNAHPSTFRGRSGDGDRSGTLAGDVTTATAATSASATQQEGRLLETSVLTPLSYGASHRAALPFMCDTRTPTTCSPCPSYDRHTTLLSLESPLPVHSGREASGTMEEQHSTGSHSASGGGGGGGASRPDTDTPLSPLNGLVSIASVRRWSSRRSGAGGVSTSSGGARTGGSDSPQKPSFSLPVPPLLTPQQQQPQSLHQQQTSQYAHHPRRSASFLTHSTSFSTGLLMEPALEAGVVDLPSDYFTRRTPSDSTHDRVRTVAERLLSDYLPSVGNAHRRHRSGASDGRSAGTRRTHEYPNAYSPLNLSDSAEASLWAGSSRRSIESWLDSRVHESSSRDDLTGQS